MELFGEQPGAPESRGSARPPLAERMRPRTVEEFVGQPHLVAEGALFRRVLDSGRIHSLILWGPPGTGKTTLARLIATRVRARFVAASAVSVGVGEIRRIVAEARRERANGRTTVFFLDEIHRFNKAQQDALLPHVEDGTLVLVGATTENPSFEVIGPLLSRSRVFTLRALADEEVKAILRRALADPRGLGPLRVRVAESLLEWTARAAAGDARAALNALEMAAEATSERDGERIVEPAIAQAAFGRQTLAYDKEGEQHFNLISALHKSLRNSDADAALYWLARILESGEDPLYVARRLVRFASEDVGLADPDALRHALAARDAAHFIGMPEGTLALAQAVVYLAAAPKSNSLYRAYGAAVRSLGEDALPPVPLHLRNAPTPLMKGLGYGAGYQYAHDLPAQAADMSCLPEELAGRRFYQPGSAGFEREIARRLADWEKRRRGAGPPPKPTHDSGPA